jgi:predicted DNA-binding transcriptional regulator AlpA
VLFPAHTFGYKQIVKNMQGKTVLINYESQELQDLFKNSLSEAFKGLNLFNNPQPEKEKQILTRKETAEMLSISLPTLHKYTMQGLVKSFHLGSSVRYRLKDVSDSLTFINVGGKR